jgi:hypothetical protein
MAEHAPCTQADYEAAARALSVGMEAHAQVRKRHNNEGYGALLVPSEFHDRCLVLARSIAASRSPIHEPLTIKVTGKAPACYEYGCTPDDPSPMTVHKSDCCPNQSRKESTDG